MAKVKWTKEQYGALDSLHRNAVRLGQMPIVSKPCNTTNDGLPWSNIKLYFECKCGYKQSGYFQVTNCKKCGKELKYNANQ